MLDELQISYLQRQFTENFFRENSADLADALELDLEIGTLKLPEKKKSLISRLTEFPSKFFGAGVTENERTALLLEREKLESDAEAVEAAIRDAKSGIAYFRSNPTEANFGGPRGIIASINLA